MAVQLQEQVADNEEFSQSDTSASKTSAGYTSGISSSMMSSSNKSYGRAAGIDYQEEGIVQTLLARIGVGMESYPDAAFKYNNSTGRAKGSTPATDMVSPTQIMAILQLEFNVSLSTAENAVLFNKFDVDQRGVASLGAILGSAKLAHDKKVYNKAMSDLMWYKNKTKRVATETQSLSGITGGQDESGKK